MTDSAPQSLPARLRSLTPRDFEVASRAAIAVAVPLFLLLALDRLDLAAYASFGAMTALYGRSEPYRVRLRSAGIAAIGLVLSVALGTILAASGAANILVAAALVVVIVGGIVVAAVYGLFPPTPLFFVFGLLVCAALPTPPEQVPLRIGLAAASAAFALAITMSGWLLRRAGRERDDGWFQQLTRSPRVRWAAVREAALWVAVAQNVFGALLAGAVATAIGIGHPYWAVVSVVAVIPPPHARHSISRSVHRIVGTAVGVLVTGALLFPEPPPFAIVIGVVIAQFGAEILVGRHYGAALVFVTPLALGVAHLASPLPVGTLLIDRLLETALGAAIGLLLVLAARWLTARKSQP
ncbi:FUSC family protein [Microterricola viridarii]|uniref:Integral membrane bound transporter domain-containing protein n=1 Tax=Microterricola viridarii TaxID=412690 RepID=A0A0Y0N1D9_9MICO|nr:FUSC family protein [Microterricola viridarii]AMB57732.1 hypothetical protein AWU67_01360 [Microterricola viridarii]